MEKSISHICRCVGINRQQFNKYVNGTSRPSAYNLGRISTYFGIAPDALLRPHEEFLTLIGEKGSESTPDISIPQPLRAAIARTIASERRELRNYLGCYFLYFVSLGWHDRVVRSFAEIYEEGGLILSKGIERYLDPISEDRHIFKYNGLVTMQGGRLFITESESLTKGALTHTILYPSYRDQITLLTGITAGVSSRTSREPAASRIVYHYIGRTANYRNAFKQCGLFDAGGKTIDPRIRALITNRINEGDGALVSHSL